MSFRRLCQLPTRGSVNISFSSKSRCCCSLPIGLKSFHNGNNQRCHSTLHSGSLTMITTCGTQTMDNKNLFDKRRHNLRLRSWHREQSKMNISINRHFASIEEMTPEEKAEKFQRPKAQTTIDEEEVTKFSELSALWWDEGGEFEALHSLNDLRVPLIRDALVSQKPLDKYNLAKPLDGFWILDVGSGGGILSEPLARLGASVIGLEASEENIKIAQAHLIHDPAIRDQIKYIQATVEDISETQAGKFDAVVASEVLEHVADVNTFVSSSCKLVRPGGSVFFTTLNKTNLSYVLGIVAAERILKLVSPGTHDWNKFVTPMDLEYMLEKNNFSTRLVHGMWYSPLSKRWSWTKDTSINYAVHAVRSPVADAEEDNPWTKSQEDAER